MLTQKAQEWALGVQEKLTGKMKTVVERSRNIVPYTTENGRFIDLTEKDINWWTNGFWGGILWQLYTLTADPMYKEEAEILEKKLDRVLMDWTGLDHDNGFKWLPTSVAHYRIDQNEESKNRAIIAANNLAGRFNLAGHFIRAWNDWGDVDRRGMAIIDCMMNLPLLYWAADVTGDPRFYQIAVAHADTAMRCFVREDGSVNHILRFDPKSGELVESLGGQGYAVGSSWTRGQTWGLYGFTLSYLHTKDERYLNTARRIAHYFIANIPENGLIPVDFRQPVEVTWEDSTAAAIAACGLIELSKAVGGRDGDIYLNAALRLLKTLDEQRVSWDPETDYLLEKCTAAYHDEKHEFSIIYGDYYFLEAILKLTGKELFIW
ncbi:MAG: glycoside hydrolase family 88 protein [Eubacterium sp.]|nr:glycoside hydrolase family 88 protein [Eubacterium sp.]MBQ6363524.1 glycoside hydrolase family 88 protein [Lachnospiraceae bacterium]